MLFYRLLITLALLPLMLFTWRKGSLTPARFGFGSPASATLRIWLHAASNGELASARPLIDALLAHPHVTLVITVNSLSAKILGDDWHLPRTDICLAPFDLRWALRRFIRNWSVTSYVGLEAEFWPNRFSTLRASNSPNALVAARLSEKSVGLVTKLALNHIDWVAPQDARSRERFALLKLDEAKLAPIVDLKSLFAPNTHARSIDIAPLYDPAITIFAASVHSGEDIKVVEAFAVAKAAAKASRVIPPGRNRRAISPVQSIMVDSRPDSQGPPSSTRSNLPSSPSKTCVAVLGLIRPDGLALGAAIGLPKACKSVWAPRCAGTRIPSLLNPAVVSTATGQSSLRCKINVRGPGQKALARAAAIGVF